MTAFLAICAVRIIWRKDQLNNGCLLRLAGYPYKDCIHQSWCHLPKPDTSQRLYTRFSLIFYAIALFETYQEAIENVICEQIRKGLRCLDTRNILLNKDHPKTKCIIYHKEIHKKRYIGKNSLKEASDNLHMAKPSIRSLSDASIKFCVYTMNFSLCSA